MFLKKLAFFLEDKINSKAFMNAKYYVTLYSSAPALKCCWWWEGPVWFVSSLLLICPASSTKVHMLFKHPGRGVCLEGGWHVFMTGSQIYRPIQCVYTRKSVWSQFCRELPISKIYHSHSLRMRLRLPLGLHIFRIVLPPPETVLSFIE